MEPSVFHRGETKAGETGLPWVSAGAGPEVSLLLQGSFHHSRRWRTVPLWLTVLEAVRLPSWGLLSGLLLGGREPVVPLVNIQPPALSSLERNVKLQMGEQSAP